MPTVSKTNQSNGATFTINVPAGYKVASSYIVFKGRDKDVTFTDSKGTSGTTWDDSSGFDTNELTTPSINIATASIPSNATLGDTHGYQINQNVTSIDNHTEGLVATGSIPTGTYYAYGAVVRAEISGEWTWAQGVKLNGESGDDLEPNIKYIKGWFANNHHLGITIWIHYTLHSAGLTAKLGGSTVATQTAQLANGTSSSQKSFSGMVAGDNVFTINTLNSSVVDVTVVYELEEEAPEGNSFFFGMNF